MDTSELTFSFKTVTRAGSTSGALGKSSAGKSASGAGGAATQLSYISGITLKDPQTGIWHTNPRQDVLEVHVRGWWANNPRQLQVSLQDLVTFIEISDGQRNSRHGARIVIGLPFDPDELGDPELRRRMDRVRSRCARRIAREFRRLTGGVVVYAIHSAPSPEQPLQIHMHLVVTRRRVGSGYTLTDDVKVLSCPGRVNQMIRHMREYCAREFNTWVRAAGSTRHFEFRSYASRHEDEDFQRRLEGLEPLERPSPMKHEGPAVRRLRRKLDAGEIIAWKDPTIQEAALQVIRENDAVRATTEAMAVRNAERRARDPEIRQLSAHLRRIEAMIGMETQRLVRGKATGDYAWRFGEHEIYLALQQEAERASDLRLRFSCLSSDGQTFLRKQFPAAVAALSTSTFARDGLGVERGRRTIYELKGLEP